MQQDMFEELVSRWFASGGDSYSDFIEEKQYETMLLEKGIKADKIRKYGFAFEGKTVLIGRAKG